MQRLTLLTAQLKRKCQDRYILEKPLVDVEPQSWTDKKVFAITKAGEFLVGFTRIAQHYLDHHDRHSRHSGKPFELATLTKVVEVKSKEEDFRYPEIKKKVVATERIEEDTVLGIYGGVVAFETEEHNNVLDWRNRFPNDSRTFELKLGKDSKDKDDNNEPKDILLINGLWYGNWTREINDIRRHPLVNGDKRKFNENVAFCDVFIQGWPVRFVISTRSICRGEELLLEYEKDFWDSIKVAIKDHEDYYGLNAKDGQTDQQREKELLSWTEMPRYNLEYMPWDSHGPRDGVSENKADGKSDESDSKRIDGDSIQAKTLNSGENQTEKNDEGMMESDHVLSRNKDTGAISTADSDMAQGENRSDVDDSVSAKDSEDGNQAMEEEEDEPGQSVYDGVAADDDDDENDGDENDGETIHDGVADDDAEVDVEEAGKSIHDGGDGPNVAGEGKNGERKEDEEEQGAVEDGASSRGSVDEEWKDAVEMKSVEMSEEEEEAAAAASERAEDANEKSSKRPRAEAEEDEDDEDDECMIIGVKEVASRTEAESGSAKRRRPDNEV